MITGFNSSVDGRWHCFLDTSFPTFHDNVQVSEHEEPSIRSHMNRHLQNILPSKSISLTLPSLEKENCYELPVLSSDKHQMLSLYVGWLQEVRPFVFSHSPLQIDLTCITQNCVKPKMTCAAEDSGLPGRDAAALTCPPHLYPVLAMKYSDTSANEWPC